MAQLRKSTALATAELAVSIVLPTRAAFQAALALTATRSIW